MPVRRFTAAELVLTQRLHLERPLLVVVLLGSAGFALAEGNAFYLLFTAAGVLVNAVALHRRSEVYVPRMVVNAALLAATGVFLVEFWGGRVVITALGHFLILIQLCKLFERKRNWDYVQIICLSMVVMIAGAVVTTGAWFALVMAAYVPVMFYVTTVLALKVSLDRQASARLAVESSSEDPRRLAWNVSAKFPGRELALGAVRGAAAAAAVAAGVFLVMPRGRTGMFFPWHDLPWRRAVTGFGGTLRLGRVGMITADPRVVMRVRIDRDGRDLGPSGYVAYLRGRVYENYREGEWVAWRGEATWPAGRLWTYGPPPGGVGVITQRVTMEPVELPTLFGIGPVVGVDLPDDMALTGSYPNMVVQRVSSNASVRYTVRSWAGPLGGPQRGYLAGIRGHSGPALRTRPVPARIADLARRWCDDLLGGAGASDPDARKLALAGRIAGHLRSEYAYTLDLSDVDPASDPVEDFLFRTRRGHCAFFASAMTLLCRAVGVRARVAGGYVAADYNPAGGAYLVRARDAHAWCEVYTPSSDWRIFDPTPPGARAGARPVGRIRKLWDELAFFWKSRIIGYGENDRQGLFGGVLRRFRRAFRAAAGAVGGTWRSIWMFVTEGRVDRNLLVLAILLPAVGGVAMLAVLVVAVIRRARLLRGQTARPPGPLPRFHRRLLKVLRRRGLRQRPDQTAREFVLSLREPLGLSADRLEQLAELIYLIRWGRRQPEAVEIRLAEGFVRRLARRLRRGGDLRRRLSGRRG